MKKIFFIIFSIVLIKYSFATDIPVKEITGDEVWQGNVIIDGVVALRAGGRLKIMPGTRILFVAKDYDGDEIGDGELYIEGEIESSGSKEAPVVFSVYSSVVQPAKWKYVMANHSKKVVFNWTIFEGAYSGLQVHFSNAMIKNCVFRKNIDGFRFSTANIVVTGCKMIQNKHGIRYEERDSTGKISTNDISHNEIGIFPVTKCKGRVYFTLNNIYQNSYNIKVGDDQKDGLSFVNNYFGYSHEKEIGETIYDKKYDKNLPEVKFKPFLKKRVRIGEDK